MDRDPAVLLWIMGSKQHAHIALAVHGEQAGPYLPGSIIHRAPLAAQVQIDGTKADGKLVVDTHLYG